MGSSKVRKCANTAILRNIFDRGVGQPGGPEIRIDQVPQAGRTFFLSLTLSL